MIVPLVALLAVATMLGNRELQQLDDLRAYRSAAGEAVDTIRAIDAIQRERHDEVDPPTATISPEIALDLDLNPATQTDRDRRLLEQLDLARGHAATGASDSAVITYGTIVDTLHDEVRTGFDDAPDATTRRWADAMVSISVALDAQLREDLEVRVGEVETGELVRHHTSATDALARFADNADIDARNALEQLTLTDPWRTLAITRQTHVADGTDINRDTWAPDARAVAANLRAIRLESAVDGLAALDTSIGATQTRLIGLAAIAGIFAAVMLAGLTLLRRSIVIPLRTLTTAANRLSRGELAPLDDRGADEIGAVARAFSTLAGTMQQLWSDIDEIQQSVEHGNFDDRIETVELEGDWRRLAETLNATLDTGEAHNTSVQDELRRRNILSELSEAAMLGESATSITDVLERALPRAVRGSSVHLHQHPSGPPHYDLGVALEPTISALELPTRVSPAIPIDLGTTSGVAGLVDFGDGPPAILVLAFGDEVPSVIEPVIGLVETAARLLAQAHRRQAAEFSATYNLEHDALTGLLNATGLRNWHSTQNDGASRAIVGVRPLRLDDLDGSFGRRTRDVVLTVMAGRLRSIDGADIVARTDDPEFALVTTSEWAASVADQIVDVFARPIALESGQLHLDVTVGLAPVARSIGEALTEVATAVRHSHGRSTEIVAFDESHREAARRRTELSQWLERAIDNGDLHVHFQPVVNALTTRTEGYECLVRGTRDGEPVSPGEFIPLAEETDMILAIGEFTLLEACSALPFLPGDDPYVAVNLSPIELADERLMSRIDAVLDSTGIDRQRIVFEVTEGATTTEDDIALLEQIRELGVTIAIDDFGTGHSNLSYLTTLPASILKLDRSLVTPIVDDPGAYAVVEKTIEIAHRLGMSVIGEGVETDDELQRLIRARCDRIQGWLTGRPQPLADLVEVRIDVPPTTIHLAPSLDES